MSTDTLNAIQPAGITLFLENGQLRYRGNRKAVAKVLPMLKAHKAELIAELQGRALKTPDTAAPKLGFVHWRTLTPEQQRGLWQIIQHGDSVCIYSEVLQAMVWWVRDNGAADRLKGDPRYQGEVIYTLAEIRELAGQAPKLLKDIHRLKQAFNATLQKVTPIECHDFERP
jgi:hypothetical protein